MRLSKTSEKLVAFVSNLQICLPDVLEEHRWLLQQQCNNFLQWKKVILSTASLKCQQTEITRDHLLENDFVDPRIRRGTPKASVKYSFKFDKFLLQMHAEGRKFDKSVMNVLPYLMSIMCMFGDTRCVEVRYSPSHLTKVLPATGEIIGSTHVNSGSTLASGHGRIDVWRQEEHAKLFFHEISHCLRCDIKHFPEQLLHKFYQAFNIDEQGCGRTYQRCRTMIFPNEAYVEIQAEIFHTMYVFDNLKDTVSYFELLDIERKWAVYQAAKVLKHNGFESLNNFFRNNHGNERAWRQESNVFSYFIIRAALMYNIPAFLNFLQKSESFLCFPLVEDESTFKKKLENFTDLCIELIRADEFRRAIEQAMKASEGDYFIRKSLRMTALELE